MNLFRVLVIGGYGFFGRRLVERLSRHRGLHVIVAGRSAAKAHQLVESLREAALSELGSVALDVNGPHLAAELSAVSANTVVCASGPFQGQQYGVARACIAAGANYIELADGREFVAGIGCLDPAATAAGLSVVSGASSVPALSSTVADHLAQGLVRTDSIDMGISPGNRTERGLSTVQAILSYCGKPLPRPATASPSFGWSGTRHHHYPAPVGRRLLSPCDVPDLTLLAPRYPGAPAVSFGAGLELTLLHRGLNVMAQLARLGLVADWSAHAELLKRAADWFQHFGSDMGAMHVTVTGQTSLGTKQTRTWHLLATEGDGPYVPTFAAAALVRRLQQGDTSFLGASPCIGMLSLDEFAREAAGLHIQMSEAPQ